MKGFLRRCAQIVGGLLLGALALSACAQDPVLGSNAAAQFAHAYHDLTNGETDLEAYRGRVEAIAQQLPDAQARELLLCANWLGAEIDPAPYRDLARSLSGGPSSGAGEENPSRLAENLAALGERLSEADGTEKSRCAALLLAKPSP